MADDLDVDAMIERFRERAAAVRKRNLPPVGVPLIVIVTSCVANPPLPSATCTVNVSTTWSFCPRKSSALSLML